MPQDPGTAGFGKQLKAEWTNAAPTSGGKKDAAKDAATAGAGAAGAGGFPGRTDLPSAGVSVASTAAIGGAAHTIKKEIRKCNYNHTEGTYRSYTEDPAFGR